MRVGGIGNVTRISSKEIFYKENYYFDQNPDGKEQKVPIDAEGLAKILDQAKRNYAFYDTMDQELSQLCVKRRAECEKKYQYVSQLAIEDEYALNGASNDWWSMIENNADCDYYHGVVKGIAEAARFAKDKAQEAKRLMEQVQKALEGIER